MLKTYGIAAQHPDEFIACQLDLGPARVLAALRDQRAALKRSPRTLDEFLTTLEQQRLVQTVARLRRDHCERPCTLPWHPDCTSPDEPGAAKAMVCPSRSHRKYLPGSPRRTCPA